MYDRVGLYRGKKSLCCVNNSKKHLTKRFMGYGGGYYDRFLKGKDVFKIGICFDAQLLMELPNETFDIPVDVVISDCRILEF